MVTVSNNFAYHGPTFSMT